MLHPDIRLTKDICRNYIEDHLFCFNADDNKKEEISKIGTVGLELEVFPYAKDPRTKRVQTVSFQDAGDGNTSLSQALIITADEYRGLAKYSATKCSDDHEAAPLEKIVFPVGDCFTFEPGGQVEIVTTPCNGLDELGVHLKSMQEILQAITQRFSVHFAQIATNPWFDIDQIGLQVKKTRYLAMNEYFESISSFGRQMMRQTCSLQVNLDLGRDQATFMKRFVAANLLAPFATALFAHSPVVAGELKEQKSYRSFLWQHLDPKRTGILPMDQIVTSFDKEDLVDAYFNFALKAPIIYISELGDKAMPMHFTLEYWLDNPIYGIWPTTKHLQNHLTLLFPEVRLRGSMEMRSIDVPPQKWQMIPVVFCTGLLFSDQHLEKTLDYLLPLTPCINELLSQSSHGFKSQQIYKMSALLMELAIDGFSSLPQAFQGTGNLQDAVKFYEHFTSRKKTFADEYLDGFDELNKYNDSLLRNLEESYCQF